MPETLVALLQVMRGGRLFCLAIGVGYAGGSRTIRCSGRPKKLTAAELKRSLSNMKTKFISSLGFIALLVASLASALDVSELRAKAEQGDASAQYELAMAYDAGQGVQRDLAQAAHWCSKAADQGYAAAQNCIGSMYQFGYGVSVDEAAAAAWYEKAAAQSYGEAYTNLGFLYDLGKGVPQDRARAVELYLKGAEKGSLNAMLNVGISYWEGAGVAVDRVEAFKWLDLARFYTQRSENMQLKWRVRGALDELQNEMSKAEIREGKQRSKEWDANHRPR